MRALLSILLFLVGLPTFAATPAEIVRQVDTLMNPDAKVLLRIAFERKGKVEETYDMKTYARDNNQKVIVRFTAPASTIGNDLIMLDRSVWMYQQAAGRTMRVPANLAFGDTGFSYGDVVRLNLTDNYNIAPKSETAKDWTLDLTTKDRQSPYYRIELTVAKDGLMPLQALCFSQTGELVKTIRYSQVQRVNGISKPTLLTVTSPLSPGERSTMEYLAEERMTLPTTYFNRKNLALRLEERN